MELEVTYPNMRDTGEGGLLMEMVCKISSTASPVVALQVQIPSSWSCKEGKNYKHEFPPHVPLSTFTRLKGNMRIYTEQ